MNKKYVSLSVALALIGVAFGSMAFGLQSLKEMKTFNGQVASISVSGEGEVATVPDIATVTFTARAEAKTVPEAQKLAEKKTKDTLTALKDLGVDDKNVKTISYTINPHYETQQIYCITTPCPMGNSVVTGYDVSNTIEVKIKKVEQAGEVLGILGKANITEVSGPSFSVDNIEKYQAEAKEKAIKAALEKAKATAKSLHVGLGDIVSYSEDNGGYYPMMYGRVSSMPMEAKASFDTVSTPTGESVIKARVTITYALD